MKEILQLIGGLSHYLYHYSGIKIGIDEWDFQWGNNYWPTITHKKKEYKEDEQ